MLVTNELTVAIKNIWPKAGFIMINKLWELGFSKLPITGGNHISQNQ